MTSPHNAEFQQHLGSTKGCSSKSRKGSSLLTNKTNSLIMFACREGPIRLIAHGLACWCGLVLSSKGWFRLDSYVRSDAILKLVLIMLALPIRKDSRWGHVDDSDNCRVQVLKPTGEMLSKLQGG